MPGIEFWIYVLGGALVVISALGTIVWNMLRAEAKDHAELIKQKADADDMAKIEERWKAELISVKEGNEKLIDKLEQKHNREIDALATRFGEALRTTETNILNQIKWMAELLRADKE